MRQAPQSPSHACRPAVLGREAACLQSREETWPQCWGGGVLPEQGPLSWEQGRGQQAWIQAETR